MIRIDGTSISMTRGDTLIVDISITDGSGEAYTPSAGDELRFAMKRAKMNPKYTDYADAEPLVTVEIPIDTMRLRVESEATKELPFGEYVYDIQLTYGDGIVDTFIPAAKLTLLPEVD